MADAHNQILVEYDDASPLVIYTPAGSTNDTSSGWKALCAAQDWRCDEHSAHTTSMAGATFAFSFWGNSVTLVGNVTLGMSYIIKLDGKDQVATPGGGPTGQELAKFDNLPQAQHVLVLNTTTLQGSPQGTFTFDYAQILIGTNTDITKASKTFVDGNNTQAITFGPGPSPPWGAYNNYPGTIVEPGLQNKTFQGTNVQGASFYYKFTGSEITYYGPCYTDTHAYTVELDGGANTQPQEFNASVPYGQHVIEDCVRYHAAGLSNTTQHSLLVTNAEAHWLTLGWLEVWDYGVINQTTSSGMGPVVGVSSPSPVVMLLLLCLVFLRIL